MGLTVLGRGLAAGDDASTIPDGQRAALGGGGGALGAAHVQGLGGALGSGGQLREAGGPRRRPG
ncbi:MAG: hypothetical protein WCF04_05370, partial [Candidatus Nanopelagicales bacterium]